MKRPKLGFISAQRSAKRSTAEDTNGSDEREDVLGFFAFAVLVVFGSLLGIVVIQTLIVENRVQLDAVTNELDEQRELNQRLRLQVIELEAPERIRDTAVARLGMVRPAERIYLPGLDPDLQAVPLPPPGDPFGPGPLPEFVLQQDEALLAAQTATTVAPTPALEGTNATETSP